MVCGRDETRIARLPDAPHPSQARAVRGDLERHFRRLIGDAHRRRTALGDFFAVLSAEQCRLHGCCTITSQRSSDRSGNPEAGVMRQDGCTTCLNWKGQTLKYAFFRLVEIGVFIGELTGRAADAPRHASTRPHESRYSLQAQRGPRRPMTRRVATMCIARWAAIRRRITAVK